MFDYTTDSVGEVFNVDNPLINHQIIPVSRNYHHHKRHLYGTLIRIPWNFPLLEVQDEVPPAGRCSECRTLKTQSGHSLVISEASG
jgi:hypothetical protein